jgi:hypothetical protein
MFANLFGPPGLLIAGEVSGYRLKGKGPTVSAVWEVARIRPWREAAGGPSLQANKRRRGMTPRRLSKLFELELTSATRAQPGQAD